MISLHQFTIIDTLLFRYTFNSSLVSCMCAVYFHFFTFQLRKKGVKFQSLVMVGSNNDKRIFEHIKLLEYWLYSIHKVASDKNEIIINHQNLTNCGLIIEVIQIMIKSPFRNKCVLYILCIKILN